MKITIFGSASGIPEKGKAHSCVGVEVGEKMFLLEIGEGASSSIAGDDLDIEKIEKVFISHTHADHFIGLPRFLQYLKWRGRKKDIEIYLPEKHIDAVEKFLPFLYIFRERFEFEYKFLPLPKDELILTENLKIKLFPTSHLKKYRKYSDIYGVETTSYGYLVEEVLNNGIGVKRFLFSSDIDSVGELKNFIEGVDLLLIECAHIGIEDIIEFVSEYNVPKVILTHISPDRDVNFMLEYARAKFDLNIEVAFDGMKIEI